MNAVHLGFYNTATTRTRVRFLFSTHAGAGANVAPSSAFETEDLRIYRAADNAAFSATQRSSTSGITMTSPFDSLTGFHGVDIDLSNNGDAGFYALGYLYLVTLAPDETVDSQTLTGIPLAYFEIGTHPVSIAPNGLTNASLAASTGLKPTREGTAQAGSASTITLDAGASAVNDWYNGHPIRITGGTGAEQDAIILDYVGSTKVATVDTTWLTNPDSTSTFAIYPSSASASDIAAAVLDDEIGDGTITAREALRVLLAAMAGKLSGAATTTITIRNAADSANVIVATVDSSGNRSAVTVTP